MVPICRELILAVILLARLVSAQSVAPRTDASSNPPPPPPPKAVTPQRIQVGSAVQSNYLGPEGRWLSFGKHLSEADITASEQSLNVNPEDICTRARLIAFAYPTPRPSSQTANRIDHLLWTIQHHPECDAFILVTSRG